MKRKQLRVQQKAKQLLLKRVILLLRVNKYQLLQRRVEVHPKVFLLVVTKAPATKATKGEVKKATKKAPAKAKAAPKATRKANILVTKMSFASKGKGNAGRAENKGSTTAKKETPKKGTPKKGSPTKRVATPKKAAVSPKKVSKQDSSEDATEKPHEKCCDAEVEEK